MDSPVIWPQFFTATILDWKHLLKGDNYKNIIITSLKFLADEKRVNIYAFAIMSNHIHIIWQPLRPYSLTQIQTSFMTFTAKYIKQKLRHDNPDLLETFRVNKYDRTYQIWKREPLSIELFTEKTFAQKLNYIHRNPVVAGLVNFPEEYKYSSALFYHSGVDEFGLITHYSGN